MNSWRTRPTIGARITPNRQQFAAADLLAARSASRQSAAIPLDFSWLQAFVRA